MHDRGADIIADQHAVGIPDASATDQCTDR
jgi:hypothetical protein